MQRRGRSRQRAAQRATLARLRNEMDAMRGQMARTLRQLQTMTDRAVSGLGYANASSTFVSEPERGKGVMDL